MKIERRKYFFGDDGNAATVFHGGEGGQGEGAQIRPC